MKYLLALLVLLTSCSSTLHYFDDPLTFRVDPAFGTSQPFEDAATKWNLFTVTAKHITPDPNGNWDIVQKAPDTGFNGLTDTSSRTVEIKPGSDPYLVSIHEFGHILGLHHTSHGVMDPLHATDQFSEEDLKECREAGACPP